MIFKAKHAFKMPLSRTASVTQFNLAEAVIYRLVLQMVYIISYS
jgi:hypothetical protein